jgi:hypothetical protein
VPSTFSILELRLPPLHKPSTPQIRRPLTLPTRGTSNDVPRKPSTSRALAKALTPPTAGLRSLRSPTFNTFGPKTSSVLGPETIDSSNLCWLAS